MFTNYINRKGRKLNIDFSNKNSLFYTIKNTNRFKEYQVYLNNRKNLVSGYSLMKVN